MSDPVLAIDDLTVTTSRGGRVLDAVSLRLGRAESLGVVGESGSGKTTLAHAILGFARPGLRISAGSVRVRGRELLGLPERELRTLRGGLVSYVPQDPATALNPSMRIGPQIAEIAALHAPGADAETLVRTVLDRVGLPSDLPFRRRFPHELSGGQQQRVAIGMALCCDPPLVVLDEPTTGLDVVTQARILTEVRRLQAELEVALVYVSHDLAAVAAVADRVVVMYAGDLVEQGPTADVISRPRHPYAQGLVSSVPDHRTASRPVGIPGTATGVERRAAGCRFAARCSYRTDACVAAPPPLEPVGPGHDVRCLHWRRTPPPVATPRLASPDRTDRTPLLELDDVSAGHRRRGVTTTVVRDVSFALEAGECVALVGESGSGKTTTARCIAGLHAASNGAIRFEGESLAGAARRRTREQRRRIQIVFQNPYGSLNPRQTVSDAVSWPARTLGGATTKGQAEQQVRELLDRVRLPAATIDRYPAELSGGERQRVAIARALGAGPRLLICDEVTSALDVSVQAATLELLGELQRDLGLALLFITHDLGVVASVADRILVMESGVVCERGLVEAVLARPQEPYTRRLIAAAPSLTADVEAQRSDLPAGAEFRG
jgi:peptide/nickel transport system ATP-binding protein